MSVYIKKIATYLPEKVVTNEEMVMDFPEWSVDKIADKIGVIERRVAADNETATDMAFAAAERLFEDNDIDKGEIDFVVFCTQSPDYKLPTSACLLQHRLGLRTNIGALDYNLGCSGYVYGLAIAKGLIACSVAKNVLLLTAETYNKYLHPRDKGNRTIFGDAATATVVSTQGFAEVGEFSLGTDGSGGDNLIVKTGMSRCPDSKNDVSFDEDGNPVSSDHLYMNGSEIFSFTQSNVPKVVKDTLAKNSIEKEDVDMFVFHQANKYMLNFLRKKMKIDEEKYYVDMSKVGNTVSNSIPLALDSAIRNGVIKKGMKVLISGFGVGYSWGGAILRF
ncbi:MAG: ketoacyl-ACP synthase III [Bacteroidaceae bacterium]|nr:ketoacyl-ACP synthase III [Bacteroidaceae bacterium]